MQTLRKLFLAKYLKEWFAITMGGILFFVVAFFLGDSMPAVLAFAGMVFIIFGPIAHGAFTNNGFQENLDWLINFQYNRKQLIKYYFLTQTLKLFLITISYTIFFSLLYYIGTSQGGKSWNLGNNFWSQAAKYLSSPSKLSIAYFVTLGSSYAIYFASLFGANKELIRRMQIRQSTKEIKVNWLTLFKDFDFKNMTTPQKAVLSLFIGVLILVFGPEISFFTVVIFMSGFVGYYSVYIFNRKFKVLTLNKEKIFAYSFCTVLMIPHFGFYIGSIAEIGSKKAAPLLRADSLMYIRPFYTADYKDYSNIVKKTKLCKTFSTLGEYAALKDFEPKLFMVKKLDFCQYKSLVQAYSREIEHSKFLPKLVNYTQDYIKKNKLSLDQQLKLALALRFHKLPMRKINTYMDSDSIFQKYLAVKIAKRSLSYRKYKTFLKANYEEFPQVIKKLGSLRRDIASLEFKEVGKKKSFNYSDY